MKIAVIHYHLKPGGVTTVIRQQLAAAGSAAQFLLFSGEPAPAEFSAKTICLPQLAYDRPDQPACPDPRATAREIVAAIKAHWPDGCDVIQVHNPLLAKNKQLLAILSALQALGQNLFLQVHDFAEDGRPGVYYGQSPYPSDCHWGVINQRDYHLLIKAGADPAGLHLVANTVTPLPTPDVEVAREKTVLYPVRAIRRKNIGEVLLHSRFFPKGQQLAITLGPNSAADVPPYQAWQSFAHTHGLPVQFEASRDRDFAEWVAAADCFITTSITEGFGFSFLEPWTAQKFLVGRALPDLTADFEQKGVQLGHLYNRLAIPTGWIDTGQLQSKISRALETSGQRFGLDPGHLPFQKFTALAEQDTLDFGFLDEHLQKQVLTRVLQQDESAQELLALNPALAPRPEAINPATIEQNRQAILQQFNWQRCRDQLLAAYQAAARQPVRHHLDKGVLLSCFFSPGNFSLLKWSTYDEA